MESAASPTRYRSLSRAQALTVLALLLGVMTWGVWLTWPAETGPAGLLMGDLPLHQAIVDRVRAGEGYYDAAHAELRAGNYPVGSMFNWRTPLYVWVLAKLPTPAWGQALLLLGALTTVLLAHAAVRKQGGRLLALTQSILLCGAFLPALSGNPLLPDTPRLYLYPEVWSGMLVALSACALAQDWRWPGLAAGLLALLFRELALPYAVVGVLLAWWCRSRKELVVWLLALALFGLYLTLHAREIGQRVTATDHTPLTRWLEGGGLKFVLTTSRVHAFLAQLPFWVTAVCVPLAWLGLAGWPGPLGTRVGLTVALYVAAFAVVGRDFNQYWGAQYIPLLTLGFVWSLPALRDLLLAVARPTPH